MIRKNENIIGLLGISGQYKRISDINKAKLTEYAINSFKTIDTASVYGAKKPINDLLGEVVSNSNSKTKIINKIGANLIEERNYEKVVCEFEREQNKFRDANIEAILMHRPSVHNFKRDKKFFVYLKNHYPNIKIGLCTNDLAVLTRYSKYSDIKYLQIAVNLIDYNSSLDLLKLAKKNNIQVLARSVLSSGIMSRKYSNINKCNFKDSIRKRFIINKRNRTILSKRLLASDKIHNYFLEAKRKKKIAIDETFERFIFTVTNASPLIDNIILGGTTLKQLIQNSNRLSDYSSNFIEDIYLKDIDSWKAPYI